MNIFLQKIIIIKFTGFQLLKKMTFCGHGHKIYHEHKVTWMGIKVTTSYNKQA
jgi:hypothetical protein